MIYGGKEVIGYGEGQGGFRGLFIMGLEMIINMV